MTAALDQLRVAGPVTPWLSAPGLKPPAFASIPEYHDTLGDEVIEFNRSVCKLYPDPQQELALNIIFARDFRLRAAAFSTAIIAPRQMLKTGVFKMATLAWLYLLQEPVVTWSAHRAETSFGAQDDLEKIIDGSDELTRATKRFVHGNGAEAIETVDRCKVNFRTRTKTGGKGLSANKVILDEAFALQLLHMGALLPTLTAMPDPQVLYGSSAAYEDSYVLHEKIDSGRPGTERDWVTDQPLAQMVPGPMAAAYLEWCAPPPELACDAGAACTHSRTSAGCGCDKEEWLLRANPAVGPVDLVGTPGGPRSTMDYLRAERRDLPAGEYARERMGWHEKSRAGASPIPMTMWFACADKESRVAAGSPVAIALAVAKDKSMAAIGLAGWREDGLPHAELVEHLPGTGWLLDRFLGIADRNNPVAAVMDPRGPSGGFEKPLRMPRQDPHDRTRLLKFITVPKDKPEPPRLRDGERVLMIVSGVEDAQACNALADRILEGTFRHPDQGPLNDAVRDARSRPVGQSWAWDEDTGRDITPIKAVTLALIGLATFGAKQAPAPFFLV